ncbi:MAG: ribonucleoside-diphosphate reductase alpha chain [Chloroflexi bacterium]|jgi:ribonucleoside-diphosphate reductase alpha chain|nr:MAG: ribonucleoside-diphosphate reductase alpha chain [Chloroflexota bacterium]
MAKGDRKHNSKSNHKTNDNEVEAVILKLKKLGVPADKISEVMSSSTQIESNNINSTNANPELNENAIVVLRKRYLRKDANGEIIETPDGMFSRVAKAISKPELTYGTELERAKTEADFYNIMASLEYVPNSPTLMNAGTGAGTLSACFVMGLEDSMEGIMTTAKEAALVQKFGGGTGFALSPIRPKGSPISSTHGKACGAVAVLRHLSSVSTLVTQGGKRDGANMAVMDIHHPDIEEFINCKTDEGQIHNFNISVGASDEFMEAVRDNKQLELKDPDTNETLSRISATDLFNKIISGAWKNGEPGMIFLDAVNRDNPTSHLGRMTATNPCGEQPLLPYESCNLGSINLSLFVKEIDGLKEVDYQRLRTVVRISTRFLDNVIDANTYSVDKIADMTRSTRKIGLGIMGFADMLMGMKIPYDSSEGVELGRKLMEFVRDESDQMSEELAKVRGNFPEWQKSKYGPDGENRPMRNACRLTVAPTGTISMIAGCSSGCEPAFALSYHKHNILEGESLVYVDKTFEYTAKEKGFYSEELMRYLADGGSIQTRKDVPEWARKVFVTASEISPESHVRMQAAFQESVDSGISKTINFPNSATEDDVRKAYMLAWELGCKGITVYRAGSRQFEVLTAGTQDTKTIENIEESEFVSPTPRSRPAVMNGITERVKTGQGNIYVTVNFDEKGRPFELFTTLGKAGSVESAQLEAISRLISLALRSGVSSDQIVDNLRGITSDPVWDSGRLVRSAPDAVAFVLHQHMHDGAEMTFKNIETGTGNSSSIQLSMMPTSTESSTEKLDDNAQPVQTKTINGITCPECSGFLIFQEGCQRCASCGYNKCE